MTSENYLVSNSDVGVEGFWHRDFIFLVSPMYISVALASALEILSIYDVIKAPKKQLFLAKLVFPMLFQFCITSESIKKPIPDAFKTQHDIAF